MSIQIYNTLTRQKEKFQTLEPGKVTFYVCGPTVYNYIHIGNARSAAAFDTIRRYLIYRGYQVEYVSNFTDVDDKIIRASIQEELSAEQIAEKYIAAFKEDTAKINILPASHHPRVMENIEEIIAFIQRLIQKGYAYESQGDVYFKTSSFPEYGRLSDQSIADLLAGASQRLIDEISERKDSPIDFALWKSAKDNEISWQSPWGKGRPGWHIECSVMATRYLGDTIDIHGGGQDLEFPHHENEIAQSECATGKQFVRYWMHNGFVTIGEQDEKMSKSLGNFVLLRDLISEVDPIVVRYLLSSTHYRRPLRFDAAAIQEARVNVEKMREVYRKLTHRLTLENICETTQEDEVDLAEIQQHCQSFIREMDNDFHAGNAMTTLFEFMKMINVYLSKENVSKRVLEKMSSVLVELTSIFGITLEDDDTIDAEIELLIEQRRLAREQKDFVTSDAIRDLLKSKGIVLDDTREGTTWKRVKS